MSKESIYAKLVRAYYKLGRSLSALCNILKLKLFGVKVSGRPYVCGHLYLERGDEAEISIGDRFRCISGGGRNRIGRNIRSGIFASPSARISIGRDVGISCSCIWAREEIVIGDGVNIGADCVVMDHDAHSLDPTIRRDRSLDRDSAATAKIVIEEDVLIGARSIVLKGTHIGKGSVIGAGSIVTGEIPPMQIWGGHPAKYIRDIPQAAAKKD